MSTEPPPTPAPEPAPFVPDEPPRSAPPSIAEKLDQLPKSPGVYIFKDAKEKPIYIGKAKSLRARVRSYFQKTDDGRMWFPFISQHARDVEWVVTANERESLLL